MDKPNQPKPNHEETTKIITAQEASANDEETLFVPPPSFKERLEAARRAQQRPTKLPEDGDKESDHHPDKPAVSSQKSG
ncbi:MAG: hypothetical protein OHK0023_25930 [Anaerolineae bacterium]